MLYSLCKAERAVGVSGLIQDVELLSLHAVEQCLVVNSYSPDSGAVAPDLNVAAGDGSDSEESQKTLRLGEI